VKGAPTIAEARAILIADRALGLTLARNFDRWRRCLCDQIEIDPPDFGVEERESWRQLVMAARDRIVAFETEQRKL